MVVEKTEDKILHAAIDLMHLKGYAGATTKEIAQMAGVSEMTVFRKFRTKQEILDAMVEKYSYAFSMKKIFTDELTYHLETDLAAVSRTYQTFMEQNKKIVLLAYKECNVHDEISERLTANPRLIKAYLIDYFTEMKKRNKLRDVNIELQVMNFLWMNLGYFSAQFISGNKVARVPVDDFIEHSVKVFAKGLSKE
ncbi:DNA-binding transcriptional regulator, AcrR family [Evansella caseinilytica]|uniref:DNA-binding transcriptional regulator, AcrR family n=1 Tax=Evansella caseinilytica TaxID=1503961 RepID=A0A1H3UMW5_9BACI|nr:TetR/AcrR family transcriptional regulator [Evansella caseinilytica]SDZ63626.1 DNA-binding transcriptional regulator, AcrR family [Evansella caseinilytica]